MDKLLRRPHWIRCPNILWPFAEVRLPDISGGNGASIFKMMDVSRHKSIDNLRTCPDAELFKNRAGAGLL